MFGVSKNKVKYKRRKFGINFMKKHIFELSKDSKLNSDYRKILLDRNNIDVISKAITHFIFRNGPIENMHANNQLSQDDMKILNKYMVNRIAGLLTAIADKKWLQLSVLLSHYMHYGIKWDKAEPDMDEIDTALEM